MGISHSDVSKEAFGFPIQLLFYEYWQIKNVLGVWAVGQVDGDGDVTLKKNDNDDDSNTR